MNDFSSIYQELHQIYEKHRRKYKENKDTKQMCLMWSTFSPPDILEGTKPIVDIEKAFNITLDEEQAFELYEMDLKQATKRIIELQNEK